MDSSTSYIQAYENDKAVGAAVEPLLNPKDIRAVFPITAKVSVPDNSRGFINRDGGWAFASQGIQRMMDKVTLLGGKIVPCRAVSELCRSDGRVSVVRCTDGGVYGADIVVLATGSWSASTFPELGLDTKCVATGYVTYIHCDSVVCEMGPKFHPLDRLWLICSCPRKRRRRTDHALCTSTSTQDSTSSQYVSESCFRSSTSDATDILFLSQIKVTL